MDLPSIETVITMGMGLGTGVASGGWVTKFFITRFLKENDKKHDLRRKENDVLSDKLSVITTDIAVIKSRMGEVINVRDDVKANIKELAISTERIKQNEEDINSGFKSVRERFTSTNECIDLLKEKLS